MSDKSGYYLRVESILRENLSHRELQQFPELTESIIEQIAEVIGQARQAGIDYALSSANSHGFKQYLLGNYKLVEAKPNSQKRDR